MRFVPALVLALLAPVIAFVAPAQATGYCGTQATKASHYAHVIVVMEENKKYASIVGSSAAPWINSAIDDCATVKGWADAGSAFPSLPNYIALTSGNTQGITKDCAPRRCSTTADNVFRQLRVAGYSAKSYAESMPGNCWLKNAKPYVPRHVPAVYYKGGNDRPACQSDVTPLGAFDPNSLPALAFVTPNVNNDMHDGTIQAGDAWLSSFVGQITASPAYTAGDVAVLVLWDENTPCPNVLMSASVTPGQAVKSSAYGHYSALRFIEDNFGVPLLGKAATAPNLTGQIAGL